ncbi:O-methyltransferase [Lactobacillus selangorensis]|uniref:O-methyltransferase n=1 Tax=Lactobacillus selangorensis TaxID=81857 RepID=A0A0R2FLY0_9LACO|nr:tRNA1(Val) (adenine(37)-N6)-methyltransferase [Lactobacillus selangorensis]KRN29617.1 O-methyltransferase [Lactobacillus selangorensis]KRN33853.1 O-methyltransferase [Lactobacillus selangorensis]
MHPDERIDQLYGQTVKIIQSDEVFSFSLDAVLLADFTRISRRSKAVDLCAGNGAVALFLSQKTSGPINLVEIQSRLADMAARSVQLNHLEDRLHVYPIDLKDAPQTLKKDAYDVVTCNPPYFADQPHSQKNPNPYLAIARHELKTDLNTVLATTSALLKTNGRASFVYRPDRFLEMCQKMVANRLIPKRIRFVYPFQNKDANMFLIEAIKDGKPGGLHLEAPLVVYDAPNQYTPEVQRLIYGD